MKIEKQKSKQAKFGYFILIEIENHEDKKSLTATLDYLIAKKNKSHFASMGKLIMLTKLIREIL